MLDSTILYTQITNIPALLMIQFNIRCYIPTKQSSKATSNCHAMLNIVLVTYTMISLREVITQLLTVLEY